MDQPAWLAAAWAEFGVAENPGNGSTAAIVSYARETGHGEIRDDQVPWCAAFAGAMLERAGIASTRSLLARSYLDWGSAVSEAKTGAIAVLTRGSDPNAGHVGFVIGAAGPRIFILGGNQGNAVSVAAFDRSRVIAYRWPAAQGSEQQPDTIFDVALRHVLKMEGGFSDDPYDPGGPTNLGITLREFAAFQGASVDGASRARLIEDLKAIRQETVSAIYLKKYWQPAGCTDLPAPLALMHFDASVNHGVGGAKRMLQQALGVTIDGEIGGETRDAARSKSIFETLAAYADIRRRRYRNLPHFWHFGRGWLARVDATIAAAKALAVSNSKREGPKAMSDDFKYPRPGEISAMPRGDDPPQPDAKWWVKSRTVWGTFITAAATVLPVLGPLIGIDISADVIKQLGDQTMTVTQGLIGLFGTLLTLYGRARAKGPLARSDVRLKV